MNENSFISKVIQIASGMGYRIENSRNGQQIIFGHKKLHEGHLRQIFQRTQKDKTIGLSVIIGEVAKGRPCTHKPMKEIYSRLSKVL